MRKAGSLTASHIIAALVPAILTGAYNWWSAQQETVQHRERGDGIAALAVNASEQASEAKAEIAALKARLARVERRSSHKTVVIRDTVSVIQKPPESRGLLWHLTHIGRSK